MCCVMPPASPDWTFACLIRSKSEVLPWSTWPITVTTGGFSTRSSAASSGNTSSRAGSSMAPSSTSTPISAATSSISSVESVRQILHRRPRLDPHGGLVSSLPDMLFDGSSLRLLPRRRRSGGRARSPAVSRASIDHDPAPLAPTPSGLCHRLLLLDGSPRSRDRRGFGSPVLRILAGSSRRLGRCSLGIRLAILAVAENPFVDGVLYCGGVMVYLYSRLPKTLYNFLTIQRFLASYLVYALAHLTP